MACYSPLSGWRARQPEPSGKYRIVFSPNQGYLDMPMTVPCGQCVGCRLDRSKAWAIRCVHEASLHDENCFITLTYNNENLPPDGSLDVTHFQKFMKRLRKRYAGKQIRFFHAGEYGSTLGRPHYHAILFGHDFDDRVHFKRTKAGSRLDRSAILESLWPFGYSSVGDCTFDSAAYVARYIMKKITGDDADDHYQGLKPEYTTMSRRPGIASEWFRRFSSDVYPSDEIIIKGKVLKPPRYYDSMYELIDEDGYNEIKSKRLREARKRSAENCADRLAVRRKVKEKQVTFLKRGLSEVNNQ